MGDRVVVVAQPLKGTLSADQVARATAAGVRAAGGEPCVVTASDGGDGLLEALAPLLGAGTTSYRVAGPRGRAVDTPLGWLDRGTAVVESRLACGLSLLEPSERNPLVTTTRGVGELIAHAVADGARRVFVGLGGSATMDGGVGMARAWGWAPRAAAAELLPEGGGALADLAGLDPGEAPAAELVGLADVRNPLTGPRGARVYAAQKGASPEVEERLARGLERLAAVTGEDGPTGLAHHPGAGAAGGLGFGLLRFGRGKLMPGAAWVLDRLDFDAVLEGAAAVLVAEGAFDPTSLEGKLTGEVVARAGSRQVPVVLLAPRAGHVPAGVIVESGGGEWDTGELERRARRGVARAFRLLRRG